MRSILLSAGILGAGGVLLYLFVFDLWIVPDDPLLAASVFPTLAPEDKMLVVRGQVPEVGELARCASPTEPETYVVGRVFGVGGDRVEIRGGQITRNGARVKARQEGDPVTLAHPVTQSLVPMRAHVGETGPTMLSLGEGRPFTFTYLTGAAGGGRIQAEVGRGKLFLVSDNRLMHQDSRDFGQIDEATCEHVVFRLWGESFRDAARRFTIVW